MNDNPARFVAAGVFLIALLIVGLLMFRNTQEEEELKQDSREVLGASDTYDSEGEILGIKESWRNSKLLSPTDGEVFEDQIEKFSDVVFIDLCIVNGNLM